MLLVIPMAGLGKRFADYGFKKNKYMLPIDAAATPMIKKAIDTLGFKECDILFIVRKDQVEHVGELPGRIVVLDELTDGPATTVKKGLVLAGIHTGPLIVANSDQIMDWNPDLFLSRAEGYDGCVLTYTPDYPLVIGNSDKNSFVEKNADGVITRVAEKVVLSDEALVGIHYYKNTQVFMEAYDSMKVRDLRAPNGEFYISNTYQALIDMGRSVCSHALGPTEKYWPVGEPFDYFHYLAQNEYSIQGFETFDRFPVRYLKVPGVYQVNGIVTCTKGPSMTKITRVDGPLVVGDGVEFCVVEVEDRFEEETTIDNFTRGWFIGDFTPTLSPRKDFEVGIRIHNKTEGNYDYHYHKDVEEFNILVWGSMILNGETLTSGQYFNIKPGQIACSIYLEDTMILCVKSASMPTDKYLI
jgi:NDP-sugar pyrophosphorylase family protein